MLGRAEDLTVLRLAAVMSGGRGREGAGDKEKMRTGDKGKLRAGDKGKMRAGAGFSEQAVHLPRCRVGIGVLCG